MRSVLAWAVVLPWLAALAAWGLGRAVGDRFLWSQYLEWIPTEAIVLSGLGVVLVEGILRGRRARRVRVPLAIVAGVLCWLLFGEWSLWRLAAADQRPADLRVSFMNISPSKRPADLSPFFALDADIAVFSNVHPNSISFEEIYGFPQSDLLERTIGLLPGDSPPSETHTLRHGPFRLYARWPIRRYASATVGPQETWIEGDITSHGRVLMVEVERPDAPFILWVVDMPRTLGASRRALFEQAADRVAAVNNAMEADTVGRWVARPITPEDPLFEPDLVVGDFNTPGHAWSVSRFKPGLRPVRADAGIGPAGTWPSAQPFFEIDLARLGPRVEALRAGRVHGDGIRHLGLWADLVRAGPP